jgi:hypothetical protein
VRTGGKGSFALGAAVLACCAAAAGPALAGSAGSDGQNHRAAIRDAGKLLARVNLPAGATPSSQEPSGDGGVLAAPALTEGVEKLVDEHAWWTVNESPAQVLNYVESHVPGGGKTDITCHGGGGGEPDWTCVTFAFPPRKGVLGVRELVVEMVGIGDGSTGVRADAEVQWIINRPASEVVPTGVQAIHIARGRPGKRISENITDASTVNKIIQLFNALPVIQPANYHCPAERGPLVRFAFRASATGQTLARAAVLAQVGPGQNGCEGMSFSIGGRQQDGLAGGRAFLRQVGKLIGVRLTERPS